MFMSMLVPTFSGISYCTFCKVMPFCLLLLVGSFAVVIFFSFLPRGICFGMCIYLWQSLIVLMLPVWLSTHCNPVTNQLLGSGLFPLFRVHSTALPHLRKLTAATSCCPSVFHVQKRHFLRNLINRSTSDSDALPYLMSGEQLVGLLL